MRLALRLLMVLIATPHVIAITIKRALGSITTRTFAAVMGASWGFWLYLMHVQDEQVARTLKYVERLQGKELAPQNERLNGFWTSPDGVAILFASSDVALRKRASERVHAEHLEKQLAAMLQFYSEVAICTRKGLCDQESSCAFFAGGMHGFFELYNPILEIWGLGQREDLLAEIRQFRDDCKKPSHRGWLKAAGVPDKWLPN